MVCQFRVRVNFVGHVHLFQFVQQDQLVRIQLLFLSLDPNSEFLFNLFNLEIIKSIVGEMNRLNRRTARNSMNQNSELLMRVQLNTRYSLLNLLSNRVLESRQHLSWRFVFFFNDSIGFYSKTQMHSLQRQMPQKLIVLYEHGQVADDFVIHRIVALDLVLWNVKILQSWVILKSVSKNLQVLASEIYVFQSQTYKVWGRWLDVLY